MLDSYLYYLFISFTVTLFLIPLGSRIIEKLDIIDKPNNRKIHTENILSGGGIVIFLSIAILFFVFQFFRGSDYDFLYLSDPILQSFLIGFLILFVMGLFDDKFDLSPKLKFLIQVVACSLFLALSGQLFSFHYFFDNTIFSFLLTLLLMLTLINAFNLIDGLDGLASGIALISITSLALFLNDTNLSYLAYMLIGSVLAFLSKNSYPAKIFLGDSGSYILGYSVAVLMIVISNTNDLFGTYNTIFLLFLSAIPLIDVICAFLRRIFSRKNIFSADKKHIHHFLLNNNITHKDTVLVLYCFHTFFIFIGLLLLDVKLNMSLFLLLLPFFYLIVKYSKHSDLSLFYGKKRFQFISTFADSRVFTYLLISFVCFLNLYSIIDSTSYQYSYDYRFIYIIVLTLNILFLFNKKFRKGVDFDYSLLFSAAIIVFSYSTAFNSEDWTAIINTYIWYPILFLVSLYIIKTKKERYIPFHPTELIIFIFFILFGLLWNNQNLIDFNYLLKLSLLLILYKIILQDSIINKYNLIHLTNILTLLFILFI